MDVAVVKIEGSSGGSPVSDGGTKESGEEERKERKWSEVKRNKKKQRIENCVST